jgi:outer membrane biosynthesis protein TonB
MRLQIAKSWDFNQMLVASVFGHLLFMTVVIFLPKSTYEEIVITPAFLVEMVDIPTNHKKAVQKNARKRKPQKKPTPEKKSTPEPEPIPPPKEMEPIRQALKMPPKPVPPDKSKKMLSKLNQLNEKPSEVLQELDQLAKLVPKVSIKKPVIKTSQPIQEKTFDELNALKNKKLEFKPSNVEPLPIEDPLDQFENLKVKELEKQQDEKSAVDLLQELAKMESKSSEVNEPQETQKQEPTLVPKKSQAYDPIIQKLESLNYEPKEIKTEIVASRSLPKAFESDIRKVNAPQQVHVEVVVSPGKAFVQSPNQGEPSADVLAQYVGLIKEKVYRNWKNPLGQDHNKLVVFSINIYRKGNIDRPELQKSSRVELLDNLALRAILESEPFPPFPEEIKSSYLGISLQFKYTPKKG